METLTSGQLAKEAQVNVETLRYYERRGLIPVPPRVSGFRQYSRDCVKRIRFIKQAQTSGFSLREILELLDTDITYDDAKRRAKTTISCIEGKLRSLQKMKGTLTMIANARIGSAVPRTIAIVSKCMW